MPDLDSGLGQSAPDQQAAMAVERVCLGAHSRDLILRGAASISCASPARKFGRRRHLLVIRSPLRIQLRLFGAAAQLLAEKHIVDVLRRKRCRQGALLKCGEKRDIGAERTSATASPAPLLAAPGTARASGGNARW